MPRPPFNMVSPSLLFFSFSLLLLTGCATQPVPMAADPPGFWLALVHGIVAPFALIGSLFMDVRIYAFPNSGFLYDLGYLLGLSAWGGGASQLRSGEQQEIDDEDEEIDDEGEQRRDDD